MINNPDLKSMALLIIIAIVISNALPIIINSSRAGTLLAEAKSISHIKEIKGYLNYHEEKNIKIQVPDRAVKIQFELYHCNSCDFDLSVTDPRGRRTGGWTSQESNVRHDIPGSEYSGYSVNPENIIVKNPVSGNWIINIYSFYGSGDFTVKVTILLNEDDNKDSNEDDCYSCKEVLISNSIGIICAEKKDRNIKIKLYQLFLLGENEGYSDTITIGLTPIGEVDLEKLSYTIDMHSFYIINDLIRVHRNFVSEYFKYKLSSYISVKGIAMEYIALLLPSSYGITFNYIYKVLSEVENLKKESNIIKSTSHNIINAINELTSRYIKILDYNEILYDIYSILLDNRIRLKDKEPSEIINFIIDRSYYLKPIDVYKNYSGELYGGSYTNTYIKVRKGDTVVLILEWYNNADLDLQVVEKASDGNILYLVGYWWAPEGIYNSFQKKFNGYTSIYHVDSYNSDKPEIAIINGIPNDGELLIFVNSYRGSTQFNLKIYVFHTND